MDAKSLREVVSNLLVEQYTNYCKWCWSLKAYWLRFKIVIETGCRSLERLDSCTTSGLHSLKAIAIVSLVKVATIIDTSQLTWKHPDFVIWTRKSKQDTSNSTWPRSLPVSAVSIVYNDDNQHWRVPSCLMFAWGWSSLGFSSATSGWMRTNGQLSNNHIQQVVVDTKCCCNVGVVFSGFGHRIHHV